MSQSDVSSASTAIVSIYDNSGLFLIDMELPMEMPIEKLRQKLLGTLKQLDDTGAYQGSQLCQIYCSGRLLQDAENLLNAGIYEGAKMIITKG